MASKSRMARPYKKTSPKGKGVFRTGTYYTQSKSGHLGGVGIGASTFYNKSVGMRTGKHRTGSAPKSFKAAHYGTMAAAGGAGAGIVGYALTGHPAFAYGAATAVGSEAVGLVAKDKILRKHTGTKRNAWMGFDPVKKKGKK